MDSAQDQQSAGAAGARHDYTAQAGTNQPSTEYVGGETESVGVFTGRTLAGTLMIISGMWTFFVGMTAIFSGGFFTTTPNYVITWNTTGWGWVQLILGIVVFAAGLSVLAGMLWARIVGVVLASVSALNNFLFLPHHPIWSLTIIAMDVFIIWALCSRTREAG